MVKYSTYSVDSKFHWYFAVVIILVFMQVQSADQCEKSVSVDAFNQASVNASIRNLSLTHGFSNVKGNDLACVTLDNDAGDMVGL